MRPLRMPVLVALVSLTSLGAAGREAPLMEAVRAGDITTVRALVLRADVNAVEPDGSTPLHWAVQRDDEQVVDLLIRAGARVAAATSLGVTPLTLACVNGNASIVAQLLKAGAPANTALPGGETVLMTASRTGRADVVRLLIAHGAQVEAREATRGQTALMWAAAEGNASVVQALVTAGADVHAVSSGPSATAGSSVRKRVDAFTPLLFAVRVGHTDAVRALLDAGATVNETAPDGSSALVIAILNAHWDLAAFLIDRGADPNAAAQGWTALHQVARTRTLSISLFPHPEATGRLSGLDVARRLIARGADPNARMTAKAFNDVYRGSGAWAPGCTPFFIAAKGVDHEMMRLLASLGADPRLKNAARTTPLMVAAGVDMSFIGEDSGTNDDTVKAVTMALEMGIDVNASNDEGETALHGAGRKGGNIVRILLDHGAAIGVRTKGGLTPLMVARGAGQQNVVTMPDAIALLNEEMLARGLQVDEPIPGVGAATR